LAPLWPEREISTARLSATGSRPLHACYRRSTWSSPRAQSTHDHYLLWGCCTTTLLSLPPLLLATLCEWRDLASYPHWLERSFLAIFIANLATGAALSFTLFYCTLINSPVTTLIVGNAKAIATTALGFAIFGSRLSSLGLFGIGLNTAGGVAYSIAKHSESQRLVTK